MTVVMFVIFLSGCAMFVGAPMDVLTYENPNMTANHQRLFVFLRGMGGSNHSFEQEGLVADVWACGLPFDMTAPNAHVGYYMNRNLI
ncbi:MAG: hypothetical protein ABFD82_00390, partial [Syntrophaceae bacterium]